MDDEMSSRKEPVNPMFGATLSAIRRLAQWDQTEVATEVLAKVRGSLKAKRNRISRLERSAAAPKVWELEKIADLFHVTTDLLLGRADFKVDSKALPQPPKRPRKLPKRDRRPPPPDAAHGTP